MFNLREFLRPSTDAPALNSLFAPHCFVDEHVVLTKTNALCAMLEIRGIDDECASDEDLETQGKRIQNALKQFDESYTLYQYVIKDDAGELAALDPAGQSSSVIETVERRRLFLEAKGLHSVRIIYAILLDNATTRVKLAQSVPGGSMRVSEAKLRNDLAVLLSQVDSFKQALDDLLQPRLLNKFEVFSFLRFLATLDQEVADSERLKYDAHVDYFMANTPVTFERERGKWQLSVNESPVEVLTLKESPGETICARSSSAPPRRTRSRKSWPVRATSLVRVKTRPKALFSKSQLSLSRRPKKRGMKGRRTTARRWARFAVV